MRCEFEEKQYEMPMNNELSWKRRIYSAGQVFENKIAIDAAIFSKNQKFWGLWDKGTGKKPKFGVTLTQEIWGVVEETWRADTFPEFKFNLFVQYKTPEYISSRWGSQYHHWKQPYFRYDIDIHQQDILDELERRISSSAIVVYACPSFSKRADLWSFSYGGKLIENSNFARPHRLRGHQKYTFVKNGKDGYACSEPARIEGTDILVEIDRMFEIVPKFKDNVEFVNTLAREIRKMIRSFDERTEKGFFAIERAMGYPEHELASSVTTILAFNLFSGTTWSVGYKMKERKAVPLISNNEDARIQGVLDTLFR